MKKTTTYLMIISLIFSLVGCGNKTAPEQETGNNPPAETAETDTNDQEKTDDSTSEPAETQSADTSDGYDLVILDSDRVVYEEADGVLILNTIEM